MIGLDDFDVEVWLDLPEMGVVGWCVLLDVDDDVTIRPGEGNVVTGTFAHVANNIIDLQVEGVAKPITCTSNHPIWSVDRQDFIQAGELIEGERLQLYSGETKRVVQKLPRPGPQTVYNLEVFGEHVYCVSQYACLVHNSYKRPSWRESEKYVKKFYEDRGFSVKEQVSYFDHDTCKFLKKGSVRPDLVVSESLFVEVKNYDVELRKQRLISTLAQQIEARKSNLPKGAKQIIWIDVRGQKLSRKKIRQLREDVQRALPQDACVGLDDIFIIQK